MKQSGNTSKMLIKVRWYKWRTTRLTVPIAIRIRARTFKKCFM